METGNWEGQLILGLGAWASVSGVTLKPGNQVRPSLEICRIQNSARYHFHICKSHHGVRSRKVTGMQNVKFRGR